MIRNYTDLIKRETFGDRFHYLALGGGVAEETFAHERWMNQEFYRSTQWRNLRNHIIVRDRGCDLAMEGYDVHADLRVHHMNPMVPEDLQDFNPDILDPEFLITTTLTTHNAIHYGDERQIPWQWEERRPGDTKLW